MVTSFVFENGPRTTNELAVRLEIAPTAVSEPAAAGALERTPDRSGRGSLGAPRAWRTVVLGLSPAERVAALRACEEAGRADVRRYRTSAIRASRSPSGRKDARNESAASCRSVASSSPSASRTATKLSPT